MKKIIPIFILLTALLTACEKESNYGVAYRITNSSSGFEVNYRDGAGILRSESVSTQSAQDVWTHSFEAGEGDILFVSAIYKDIHSAIRVQITLDGKVFKEGSSAGDTVRYVTVSGTVPY